MFFIASCIEQCQTLRSGAEHERTGRWGTETFFFASTPLEPCSPRSSPSRSSMQWSRIAADSRASALSRFRLPSKQPSLANPKRTPTTAGTAAWVPRSGGQMSVSSYLGTSPLFPLSCPLISCILPGDSPNFPTARRPRQRIAQRPGP